MNDVRKALTSAVTFLAGVALTWGVIFGAAVLEKIVQ